MLLVCLMKPRKILSSHHEDFLRHRLSRYKGVGGQAALFIAFFSHLQDFFEPLLLSKYHSEFFSFSTNFPIGSSENR